MRLEVTAPAVVEVPPLPGLGRLGEALTWWAQVSGRWPAAAPSAVRRVTAPASLAEGTARADALADEGADLLLVGSAGDAVPGLVALSALLDLEPTRSVALSSPDWARLVGGIRDGLRRVRLHTGAPVELLRALGDDEIAGLTGVLAQAAVRRTPVLLDASAAVSAAAMLAERVAPGAPTWWLAGAVPTSVAAVKGLGTLGMTGLLDLGVEGPEAAELALLVLQRGLEVAGG